MSDKWYQVHSLYSRLSLECYMWLTDTLLSELCQSNWKASSRTRRGNTKSRLDRYGYLRDYLFLSSFAPSSFAFRCFGSSRFNSLPSLSLNLDPSHGLRLFGRTVGCKLVPDRVRRYTPYLCTYKKPQVTCSSCVPWAFPSLT